LRIAKAEVCREVDELGRGWKGILNWEEEAKCEFESVDKTGVIKESEDGKEENDEVQGE
jgi:hypothetical protein